MWSRFFLTYLYFCLKSGFPFAQSVCGKRRQGMLQCPHHSTFPWVRRRRDSLMYPKTSEIWQRVMLFVSTSSSDHRNMRFHCHSSSSAIKMTKNHIPSSVRQSTLYLFLLNLLCWRRKGQKVCHGLCDSCGVHATSVKHFWTHFGQRNEHQGEGRCNNFLQDDFLIMYRYAEKVKGEVAWSRNLSFDFFANQYHFPPLS